MVDYKINIFKVIFDKVDALNKQKIVIYSMRSIF